MPLLCGAALAYPSAPTSTGSCSETAGGRRAASGRRHRPSAGYAPCWRSADGPGGPGGSAPGEQPSLRQHFPPYSLESRVLRESQWRPGVGGAPTKPRPVFAPRPQRNRTRGLAARSEPEWNVRGALHRAWGREDSGAPFCLLGTENWGSKGRGRGHVHPVALSPPAASASEAISAALCTEAEGARAWELAHLRKGSV